MDDRALNEALRETDKIQDTSRLQYARAHKPSRRSFLRVVPLAVGIGAAAGVAKHAGITLDDVVGGAISTTKRVMQRLHDNSSQMQFDSTARDIASLIKRGIDKSDRWLGKEYQAVDNLYNNAVAKARIASQGLAWNNPNMQIYKELEVNVLMRQAQMLAMANNLSPRGAKVYDFGDISVVSDVELNSRNKGYNLFRALEDYEKAEAIWNDASANEISFPASIGITELKRWDAIAQPRYIYKKMEETIMALMNKFPQYKDRLETKMRKLNDRRISYTESVLSK